LRGLEERKPSFQC